MKHTLIIGPAASGKSRTASLLSSRDGARGFMDMRNYRHVAVGSFIHALANRLSSQACEKEQTIIFEELPKKHLYAMMEYLIEEDHLINQRNKDPFIMKIRGIITADCKTLYADVPKIKHLLHRFNIIECIQSSDHAINMIMHHPVEIDPAYQKEQ